MSAIRFDPYAPSADWTQPPSDHLPAPWQDPMPLDRCDPRNPYWSRECQGLIDTPALRLVQPDDEIAVLLAPSMSLMDASSATTVPEPSSLLLLAVALGLVSVARRARACALVLLCLLLPIVASAQTPAPPPAAEAPAPPALSPLHAAQVDAHLARLRALRAELQLQQLVLNQERDTLDAAIRAAYPGYAPDWQTGALVAAPPKTDAPQESTP